MAAIEVGLRLAAAALGGTSGTVSAVSANGSTVLVATP